MIKNEDEKWKDIHDILALELQTTIKLYITNLYEDSFEDKYTYFKNTNLVSNNFMVQRYIKKHGKYIYHHDFHKNKEGHRKQHRNRSQRVVPRQQTFASRKQH